MPCEEYDLLVDSDVNRHSRNEVPQDVNVKASVLSGSGEADPIPDENSQGGDPSLVGLIEIAELWTPKLLFWTLKARGRHISRQGIPGGEYKPEGEYPVESINRKGNTRWRGEGDRRKGYWYA